MLRCWTALMVLLHKAVARFCGVMRHFEAKSLAIQFFSPRHGRRKVHSNALGSGLAWTTACGCTALQASVHPRCLCSVLRPRGVLGWLSIISSLEQ